MYRFIGFAHSVPLTFGRTANSLKVVFIVTLSFGESVLPCKPAAGVLEGDSAGGFAAQDPDKAAVQKDIEGRMRAAARH